MAFIGETRENSDSPWQLCVCLDKKDCKMLVEAVGKVVARRLRSFEYYKGIMEAGEATAKQEDKYWEAEEAFDNIVVIQQTIASYLGK